MPSTKLESKQNWLQPAVLILALAVFPAILIEQLLLLKIALLFVLAIGIIQQIISNQITSFGLYEFIFAIVCIASFLSFFWTDHPAIIWTKSFDLLLLFVLSITLGSHKSLYHNNSNFYTILAICGFNLICIFFVFYKIYSTGTAGFNFNEYNQFGRILQSGGNAIAIIQLFIFILLFHFRNYHQKFSCVVTTLLFLTLISIIMLNSRAVTIALVLIAITWGITLQKIQWKRLLVIAAVLIASVGTLIFSLNDSSRFIQNYNPLKSIEAGDGDERLKIWQQTIQLSQESLITGMGPGHWPLVFPKANMHEFGLWADRASYYQHAHNFFIEAFAEYGLIMFLLFLYLFLSPLRRMLKSKDHLAISIIIASIMSLCFYGISYASMHSFHPTLYILFMFIALRSGKEKPMGQQKLVGGIISFLIAICIFYFCYIYQQTRILKTKRNAKLENKSNYFNRISKSYHPIFNRYLKTIPVKEVIAKKEMRANLLYAAKTNLEQALADSPNRYPLWHERGMLHLELKEYKTAKTCFERAIAIRENYYRSQIALARLAFETKNDEDLKKQIEYYDKHLEPLFLEKYNDQVWYTNKKDAQFFWKRRCMYKDSIDQYKALAQSRDFQVN